MSTQIVGRFIHINLEDNQLPTRWALRGGVYDGAQVLDIETAVEVLLTKEHAWDDWYNPINHTRIALLKVSGFSGDKGHLGYSAILEEDLVEMRVADIDNSSLPWAFMELALELIEEGADIDEQAVYEGCTDWIHEHTDSVIEMLWDYADRVEPEFIDTLSLPGVGVA